LRICIVGKFPPIQGGVSMRTYWTAHALAARGHEVHVVTNAKEACPPFRMHMSAEDWIRCETQLDIGSVKVHWSDPVDRTQSYIPMASPFVSKLASIAAHVHATRPFDVILSYYMEPYAVAGHLAAEIAGVPHVVRMAGSDAGRLWRHPQFEPLYDHVLRSAEFVLAAGVVAERAKSRGIDPARIASGGGFVLPEDLFTPAGPALDLAKLRSEIERDPLMRHQLWGEFHANRHYFGVCGKLGENKGSFALLAAMQRLKLSGLDIGLVVLAHGRPEVEERFRGLVRKLGLTDCVLQIPFLPHWRVPEFLRGCLAVCCLEQDFPIAFHTPIVPLEVLLCGRCLIGSAEVIRKLPDYERLPSGYGCVAIKDVNDVEELSTRLTAIVQDPAPANTIGKRGYEFAREAQNKIDFPHTLERILEAAASRQKLSPVGDEPLFNAAEKTQDYRFPLTQLAMGEMAKRRGETDPPKVDQPIDLASAREVLATIEHDMRKGCPGLKSLASAVGVEVAIATAESETVNSDQAVYSDPLFSLQISRWGIEDADFAALLPVCDPRLRILRFNDDISQFHGLRTAAQLPAEPTPGPSYVVAFAGEGGAKGPLFIDRATARILELSDGTRTAREICGYLKCDGGSSNAKNELEWIKNLFVNRLVQLKDPRISANDTRGSFRGY
jgi:glycosyltransferase involved in cell wall biosynthesis